MRVSRSFIGIAAALFVTPLFAAASWINGAIDFVLVQDGGTPGDTGIVMVVMQTNSAYLPACHSGLQNRVFIDLSRAAAKAQVAVLLTAQAAGKPVSIDLNESCLQGYALIRNVSVGH